MRRRTPSFTAVEDQLVSSGLQPDRVSIKRILWESASNVFFADGIVRRKVPDALAFDVGTANPVRGLNQQYTSVGGRWLWAGANGRIVRWQFGAPEVIDAAFGTYRADAAATWRPTFYDFTQFGDWMIVNDSVMAAKIYKPAVGAVAASWATFAPGQAPVGAVRFLKKMNFIMALGYGPRGTQVGWTDSDHVEDWTASATNLAGSLSIEELNTPIRAGCNLGDAVAVYSEDQLALVKYISLPYVFGQKTAIDGIGAIGKMAVASDTRVNVGVGRAGCWWTDGNSTKYIDEGYLSNYLQDNVNWAQGSKIVVARNDYTGCFEFHFPMLDSNIINEAWSWDPKTHGWSPCITASMMDERRLFDHPIHGTNGGLVNLTDYDITAAGALSLVSKPLIMQTAESPHVIARIDEVDLLLHTAAYIEFRIGSCDEPNGAWEWTPFMAASAGAKLYTIPELPEAPYWKLELRSTPGQTSWQLNFQGFLLYGETVGTKG